MRVSVFGMGYVGVVSAACLADAGHTVVGVDISPAKIKMIAAGETPILEERIDSLVKSTVATGKLRATDDSLAAVADTDVSFISAGTPPGPTGAPSLEAVDACVAAIGKAAASKKGPHTVVVRSTIPPGTTEKRLKPILEQAAGRRVGDRLNLCFNPEFLREGSSVRDFYKPPQTIIGSMTPEGYDTVERLYVGIEAPVIRTTCTLAESVKYLCNAFHAVKIGFANEVGAVLKTLGVDSRDAMAMFCNDTVLNISTAYLRPGFAFGGSCLPKDLKAMLSLARQQNVQVPFLGHLLESNELHVERAFAMVQRHRKRKVALFGLAFKPGTDDLRESPLVTLAEKLIGKGYDLAIFDPYVDSSRLLGKNREFIEREIPHFERLMAATAADAIARSETIVVGHASPETQAAIAEGHGGRPVIDLQGARALQAVDGMAYEGICW